MATLLDTGLLEFLKPLFVALLIYALMYATLNKSGLFDKQINAWVALAVAVLFMAMPGASELIEFITPWFAVMFVVVFVLWLVFLFMGAKEKDLASVMKLGRVYWTLIILGILIIIAGMINVWGPIFGAPAVSPETGAGIGSELQWTIFHPRVLAAVFLLLVISQAIRLIGAKED